MKIKYNAPVILTFTLICVVVLAVGGPLENLFVVGASMNPANPIDYFRLISHIAGHADWNHLIGNFTFILLIGPILEEKYGSSTLLVMMLLTGLITGILNVLFFPTGLLGASGIVFMFILLSSISNAKAGEIPLTFILIAALYIGKEVITAATQTDNVSHFAHIIGGVCGAAFGFIINQNRNNDQVKSKQVEV